MQNPVEDSASTIVRATGSRFPRVVSDNLDTDTTGFGVDPLQIRAGDLAIPGAAVLLASCQIQPATGPCFRIPVSAGPFRIARLRPGRTE